MEWNTNSDKLILNWLANCTPPSCIIFNLLLMSLAINPNFEVVKKIPCVRHIQVLFTVLSDVTQDISGKTISEYTKIKQLHTEGTSHNGTEIVSIVCSILKKDNQLKTICLAGDIIPDDVTAACQSAAIVN